MEQLVWGFDVFYEFAGDDRIVPPPIIQIPNQEDITADMSLISGRNPGGLQIQPRHLTVVSQQTRVDTSRIPDVQDLTPSRPTGQLSQSLAFVRPRCKRSPVHEQLLAWCQSRL